jgi:transcriptional accessory protein Tex/SPT6
MFRFIARLLLAVCLALTVPVFASTSAVDVNKATQAELETIKGIGPAHAKRIVEKFGPKVFEFRTKPLGGLLIFDHSWAS